MHNPKILRHLLFLTAVLPCLACTTLFPATGGVTAADASQLLDVAGSIADVQPGDVKAGDAKVGDATAAEVLPVDVHVDAAGEIDAFPSGCDAIQAAISALEPALAECTAAGGCQRFEYPICNSFGCFQAPVAKGKDLTQLQALANAAMQAQCAGFHCGCASLPPEPYCLGQACRVCPPDCGGGSCADLDAALTQAAVAVRGYPCSSDSDCTVSQTPFCEIPGAGCYAIAHAVKAELSEWNALVNQWQLQKCATAACDCMGTNKATCVQGICTGG